MRCHYPRRRWFVTLQTVVVAAMLIGLPRLSVASQTEGFHLDRVRTDSQTIAASIREGSLRSTTFRHLVERVDATDGLVYVEEGKCRYGVQACLLLAMAVAGPHRVLKILVSHQKTGEDLIESIGHELQHALEALSEPGIRNGPDMYFFFQRVGRPVGDTLETDAAIRVGLDIHAELGASRSVGSSKNWRLFKRALNGTRD
jgi:hypothetical protein